MRLATISRNNCKNASEPCLPKNTAMVNNAHNRGHLGSEPLSPSEFCSIRVVGSMSVSRGAQISEGGSGGSGDAVVLFVSEVLG